jgi:beta-lactamase superfamily II metal-dependent hydrolase
VPKTDGQVTTAGSAFVTTSSNNTHQSNTPKLNNGKGVIDYVVLTHPHSDHIGGMIELMKNFNIGKVIVPKYFELKDWTSGIVATEKNKSEIDLLEYDYKIYNDTLDALYKNRQPVVEAEPQGYIDSEKILQFLSINKDYTNIESKNFYDAYWATNDNSAIVYLNYYDLQGLFTGDIQWNSENDFVSRKALKNNQVDILKVPHHGNVGSSSYTFIGYVQPTIGVITRAKEAINTNSEPYDVLTTCGVNIYELSATNGLSVYATKDNWNIENN